MNTIKKTLAEIVKNPIQLDPEWEISIYLNDDNLTYLAFNKKNKEALWIDPVENDFDLLIRESKLLDSYRFIGVIDTHTHADHLSCAGKLAHQLNVPLIMHRNAPTNNVDLRVSRDTLISTASGPLKLLQTPGHTWDCITPIWGPYIFTGDTILFGDAGRDDLPTGNPSEHFRSLEKIKMNCSPNQIFLPGHDSMGGQASSWEHQMKINPSLMQSESDFVKEATEYSGPSPKLLKESLFHNFK